MNCSRDVLGNVCHNYGTCSSAGQCMCDAGLQSGWDGTTFLPCCALKGDCNWLGLGLFITALVLGFILVGAYFGLKFNIIKSARLKAWEATIQQTLLGDQQPTSTVVDKDPFQGQFSRSATRQDKILAALSLSSYVVARGLLVFTLVSPSVLPNHLARIGNFVVEGAQGVGSPAVVDCSCGTSNSSWFREGECASQLAKSLEPFYYPFIMDFLLLVLGWRLKKYFPLSLHNSLAPFFYGVVYNRTRTPAPPPTAKEVSPAEIIVSVPDQSQPSPRSPAVQDPPVLNEFACWEKCILGWLLAIPFAGFAVPYRDFFTNVDVWAPCNGVIYGTKDVVMVLMSVQPAFGALCLTIAWWSDVCGVLCCWCICRRCCHGNRTHNLYRIGWEKI